MLRSAAYVGALYFLRYFLSAVNVDAIEARCQRMPVVSRKIRLGDRRSQGVQVLELAEFKELNIHGARHTAGVA